MTLNATCNFTSALKFFRRFFPNTYTHTTDHNSAVFQKTRTHVSSAGKTEELTRRKTNFAYNYTTFILETPNSEVFA
jgi:hypothetical protein